MSKHTDVPITKTSTNEHAFVATDASVLTNDSYITIGGITNKVSAFVTVGVVRHTANGLSHAIENDPLMLSVTHVSS